MKFYLLLAAIVYLVSQGAVIIPDTTKQAFGEWFDSVANATKTFNASIQK